MDVLVTTINLAAIYSLVAVGIALAWAGLGFLNLAHGATFAAAGYGAWWASNNIVSETSAPAAQSAVTLAAGIVVGAVAGAIICLVVFLPLDGRLNFDTRTMIATLALTFIGTNVYQLVFGPRTKELPFLFGTDKFDLAGTKITADKSGAIISVTILMALLVTALARTRIGLAVRALTQNSEGAAIVGIGRKQAAFAILMAAGALAGVASVLLSQVFYVAPNAGFLPLVKGMIVALLGGLGSISGTVIAALMVGATEALTARYLNQGYVLMTLFGLIVVVLTIRPRGVGGLLEATRA